MDGNSAHTLFAIGDISARFNLILAYIDPGAGSMILQLLLGGLAGLFVIGRIFRQRISKFFGFGKHDDKK